MIDLLEIGNEEVLVWMVGVVDGDGVSVGEGILFEGTQQDTTLGAVGFNVVTGEEEVFAVNPHFSVINVAEKESHGAMVIITFVMPLVSHTGSMVQLLKEGLENE